MLLPKHISKDRHEHNFLYYTILKMA